MGLENYNFHGRYYVNTNQKFNFTDIFASSDQGVDLAVVLRSIKHYLTLFCQYSSLNLIFRKRYFENWPKSCKNMFLWKFIPQKYLIIFILYLIGTCEMTRDQCLEGEKSRVGATILATFLIIIFFLVFYIQPSYSKTRMEYFNIKIRLLIRET